MEFVRPVPDRIEIGAAFHQRVHSVVDGNEPNALRWQIELCQLTHLQILTAQTRHILDDQRFDLVPLDHFDDLFPGGPIKICPRVPVVRQEDRILKTIGLGISFEEKALIDDAV